MALKSKKVKEIRVSKKAKKSQNSTKAIENLYDLAKTKAILDMKLQRLAELEKAKLSKELEELVEEIKQLEILLNSSTNDKKEIEISEKNRKIKKENQSKEKSKNNSKVKKKDKITQKNKKEEKTKKKNKSIKKIDNPELISELSTVKNRSKTNRLVEKKPKEKSDKTYTKKQIKKHKEFKERKKQLARITKLHSKEILGGKIVSIANNIPDVEENIIELFDVKKSYLTGDLEYEVLKGINLKIKKGTFVVILGPSGSGKTTLLNIISGLDKANQGDVFVSGYNLSLLKDSHLTKFRRDNVGFIFQQYNLLTNLTARENAEVGENLAKTKNKALGIDEIFKVIEMDEHMNKFPSQLSGGQQQRVSIGRALAKNPKILFCDEPTGALDEEMGRKVLEILLDVNKTFKTSIIMVTHNPNFQYVANTVINVKNGKITSVKNNSNPKKPSEINWG